METISLKDMPVKLKGTRRFSQRNRESSWNLTGTKGTGPSLKLIDKGSSISCWVSCGMTTHRLDYCRSSWRRFVIVLSTLLKFVVTVPQFAESIPFWLSAYLFNQTLFVFMNCIYIRTLRYQKRFIGDLFPHTSNNFWWFGTVWGWIILFEDKGLQARRNDLLSKWRGLITKAPFKLSRFLMKTVWTCSVLAYRSHCNVFLFGIIWKQFIRKPYTLYTILLSYANVSIPFSYENSKV